MRTPEERVTHPWRDFFDRQAHESPLYRAQAGVYGRSLAAAVGLDAHDRVLDFGCGFGLVTTVLAPLVAEISWWDPSPGMRAAAARNTAHLANARFCDLSGFSSSGPEPPAGRASAFDVVLVNSVAQYMSLEELSVWLPRWRGMLSSEGKLVLSDLIPPGHRGVLDVADLLRMGVRERCPVRAINAAVGGVVHYWRTARAAPLTRIAREDLARRAAAADLDATVLPLNLTHFRYRWAAVLRRRAGRT